MTTVDASVRIDQRPEQQDHSPDYTPCGSYKAAKILASARRREGLHAYAVFVVALDHWCVR